jgi:ABC-2 type transport system ATP-binding protein
VVGALLSRPEDSGDGDPAVQTRSLSRRFAAIDAVSDLTLRVERGQIFGFLGPNGAGKTTTIKMLCGLLEPTSGSARVAGCDIRTERDRIKRATGYMAQTFSLYPDLTSEENFRFFGGVYGIQGKEADHRLDEVFTQLGIDEIRRAEAGTLSGGWKQRLALACALVHSPRLLFLDEPTAGVDPSQRQRMWDFLYELCEGGTSLFVTTHYLDEAERCHSVGFMLGGRLIAEGAPAALRERLRHRLVGAEVQRVVEATRALRGLPGVADVTIHGYELRVLFDEPVDWEAVAGRLHAVAEGAGAPLRRVYPLDPTLEDLFIGYARGHATAT